MNSLFPFSLKRLAFIGIGALTAISAYMNSDWGFVGLGSVFAIMGILGHGCAGNSCLWNSGNRFSKATTAPEEEVEFKEIK